jgi:putative oxidoreductase
MTSSLDQYAPRALAILRIVTGLLFLQHGLQKLANFPPQTFDMAAEMGALVYIAGIMEVVGGALIIVGLFTRPVAFLLSGMMAVAYFMAHMPMSFFPANNMGEAAIFFCFVFLYLVFAGPGAWSLDDGRARVTRA